MSLELPGLVFAYQVHADGTARRLTDQQAADPIPPSDGWRWIHLDLNDQRVRHRIDADAALSEEARELLLSDDRHPRLEWLDQELIGVLPDVHHESVPEDEQHVVHDELQFGRLYMVMTAERVITGRRHPLHAAERVRRVIANGRLCPTEPIDLIEALISRFASLYGVVATRMTDVLDDIEDKVLDDDPHDERRRLAPMRRSAVALRRQLTPVAMMFAALTEADDLPEPLSEAATRVSQRLDALSHDIEAIQERARLLNEQIVMDLAEQTNRHLFLLSVMSALLLPPTLVAGIFGMNTSSLPWTDGDGGSWWAMGLAGVSAVAAFIALVRLGVARRR